MNADNTIKTIIKNTLRAIKNGRVTTADQKAAAARWLARLDQIEQLATAPEPEHKPAA